MVMRKATPARILPAGVLGWAFGLLAANPCGAQRLADLLAVPPLRVETPARAATWSRRIAARTVGAAAIAPASALQRFGHAPRNLFVNNHSSKFPPRKPGMRIAFFPLTREGVYPC